MSPYCKQLDGLNPNPEDCGSFYHCSNGNAYLVKCPDGLHFSVESKVCERPCDAKCDLTIDCIPTTTTSTTTTTTAVPTSPYCKQLNGLNLNPEDCGSFYQCSNGRAHLVKCPEGLHFNAEHEVCERPCDAKCDPALDCRPTTTTSTTTTTVLPISQYCKQLNGLNPNPEDCGSFYQCSNGRAYLVKCPEGLHFSSEYEVCERPCDAQCDLTVDCTPTISSYCKQLNGLNPNPEDCGSFYQCSNGREHLVKCPEGLHFSAEYEVCERPCDAQCDLTLDCTPSTTSTTTSTTKPPISPYCIHNNGINPNPDDCGSFFQCSNGQAHLVNCPDGLHFSSKEEICERPCDAKCDPSVDCPISPGNCSCEACYLPDPVDCSAYYFCQDGRLTEHYCPQGLLFNKATRMCDMEKNVQCIPTGDPAMCRSPHGVFPFPGDCQKYVYCENNVAYVMSCSPWEEFNYATGACEQEHGSCGPSTVSPHCPTSTGLFPHESDCTLFYHCDHGVAYLKDCPRPLYFNPRLEVCDWPWNVVECGQGFTLPVTASSTTTISYIRSSTEPSKSPTVSPTTNSTDSSSVSPTQTVSVTPFPSCHIVPGVICPCACRVPTYDDCSTFYQCREDGTACKKSCPMGLYFNKRKMVCDLPKNVECRDFYFSMMKQKQSRKSFINLTFSDV